MNNVERFEELKRRARERASICPNYPDDPEYVIEMDETIRAAMPLQMAALVALEEEEEDG